MSELAFERFGVALEATSGTAEAAPTHYFPFNGTLKPEYTTYRPEESRGIRAQYVRSKRTKEWSSWESEDFGADVYALPVLLNMAVAANSSPSTPVGATDARLWTFTRSMAASTEKTGTVFWGDPNVQSFDAPYGVVDSFSIVGDASGDDAVTAHFAGRAQAMAKISAPTWPAQLVGPLVTPLESQLWMDTSSAIGTTALTARVISAEFNSGDLRGDPKFYFSGPGAAKTYTRFGVLKSAATLRLRFELLDATQYDLMAAGTVTKTRVRFNGPLIEAGFYHYIQVDMYGPLDEPDWGNFAGTNRTLDVTITSEYDTTAATDWSIAIQNDRDSL
jgi:hypothetical protein